MTKSPYDDWERQLRIKETRRKRQLKAAAAGAAVGGIVGSIGGPMGAFVGAAGGYWAGAALNQHIPAAPDTTLKLPVVPKHSVSKEGAAWLFPYREDVE